MFKKIKEFFFGKPAVERKAIPEPQSIISNGPLPSEEKIVYLDIDQVSPRTSEAKKRVRNVKKTIVKQAPEKKERKPRTPKVPTPVEKVAKEKASAKTKAPKLEVVKSTKTKSTSKSKKT